MENNSALDLSQHCSITTANQVRKIIVPLSSAFQIKHFRYLKLYNNGSRIILSNFADCTRFMYELGHYKTMWYDGAFPDKLTEGWHMWDVMRTLSCGNIIMPKEITSFEREINQNLGLFHGVTYINKGIGFYEIYSFDSATPAIYEIDYKLLKKFMLYFKEQAKKLIEQSEHEKLSIKLARPIDEHGLASTKDKISTFLQETRVTRYYLDGKYRNIYLTAKEAQCVYWLIQGKSAEEIALIEQISKRTVEDYLENIRGKLQCSKQTQIARILLETGFLDIFNLAIN